MRSSDAETDERHRFPKVLILADQKEIYRARFSNRIIRFNPVASRGTGIADCLSTVDFGMACGG